MRNKSQVVLPIKLEIKLPKDDFVYKVAEICDELDYTELFNTCVRTWRKVNPITIFEIIVFAYMEHIYSGREIEKECLTDIRFMWLLDGEPAPSHATISRFQDERLSGVIEELFYQFVEKLYELGEIKYKNLFVDGTKFEAYANKYTFVWKSAVEKNLAKINAKIEKALPVICERCPHRDKCHKSKNGYRTIRVNQVLKEHRPKVLKALTSEEGALWMMNRSIQVEGVFGVLKEDYGFRRFITRGKTNIETQFFLLAFAFNIEKLCNRAKKGRTGLDLFKLNASYTVFHKLILFKFRGFSTSSFCYALFSPVFGFLLLDVIFLLFFSMWVGSFFDLRQPHFYVILTLKPPKHQHPHHQNHTF